MLALGDLLTQVQRKTPVVHIVLNNGMLDFVNIEQQEAGIVPFGTDFVNPDFSRVAEALGARGTMSPAIPHRRRCQRSPRAYLAPESPGFRSRGRTRPYPPRER